MIGAVGLERTVQITEGDWLSAITILAVFSIFFGAMYLIGWLVDRKRNNAK